MINEVIEEVNNFHMHMVKLKSASRLFPSVYTETIPKIVFGEIRQELWLSTIDHFVYNDIVFSRHFVESQVMFDGSTEEKLYKRLYNNIGLSRLYASPTSYDTVVRVINKTE